MAILRLLSLILLIGLAFAPQAAPALDSGLEKPRALTVEALVEVAQAQAPRDTPDPAQPRADGVFAARPGSVPPTLLACPVGLTVPRGRPRDRPAPLPASHAPPVATETHLLPVSFAKVQSCATISTSGSCWCWSRAF